MLLGGYQKLTLIDYPGKVAATVFTAGCNFRCPFCHNPGLVDCLVGGMNLSDNLEKEFFDFLAKRKDQLEGVCVTGGEPTLQPDIIEFVKKIKKLGFAVKFDTNGTRPDVVRKLINLKLVDYFAMDIKNSLDRYKETVGVKTVDLERIKLSARLIMGSGINYEFRTTVVPGIHTEKDFEKIVQWIKGAKAYCLQPYQDAKILDASLRKKIKGRTIDLEKIKKKIEKNFGKITIRS